ncbi:MAG TPA: isocitrate lyase/phosphoenolpyruvate mutase family protein, partial [Chthonomonadaceae bacterium]|nr:isocitrate lyase/phosphoenolpyruvate mutase family protein [Chthonomonadaceae bacterium]
ILVLPNAWDAASARIFEAAGFPAVATTSGGVANALGYPDGQHIPREEMLFVVRRIARTVEIPVTADIEAGFGAAVEEVVETVRRVIEAGAVGINLEDSIRSEERELLPIADQVERIQAARALGEAIGVPLVINARTDAYLVPMEPAARFNVAVERANAYLAAGADCAFPILATEAETIGRLAQAIHGPINVLALPGVPDVGELERLGVKRVSLGAGPCRAAMGLTRRIAQELKARGSYAAFLEGAMPSGEANGLFALDSSG